LGFEVARQLAALGLSTRDDHVSGLTRPATRYSVELHPLDYEWYFTPDTARMLARQLGSRTDVVCIGTPTVASALAEAHVHMRLIDRNPLVERRFPNIPRHSVRVAAVHDIPIGFDDPDAVIFDAPWYYGDLRYWMLTAQALGRPGALVLFSLFPSGTRPSAPRERTRLLRLARAMGDLTVHHRVLHYETPLFEEHALSAANLRGIGDWRRGDLFELRLGHGPSFRLSLERRIRRLIARRQPGWRTFVVGAQVIKLRMRRTHLLGAAVRSVRGCPNDVLPTVSARDRRRSSIGLWTSRNRVLSVGRPRAVEQFLAALQRGLDPTTALQTVASTGGDLDRASVVHLTRILGIMP